MSRASHKVLLVLAAVLAVSIALGVIGFRRSTPGVEQSVDLFVAASLADATADLVERFKARHPVDVTMNVASSGTLARQLVASPRDAVFLSADLESIDLLARAGLVADGDRATHLTNRLVVVARSDSTFAEVESREALAALRFTRLCIGDPDAVPAGRYATAWLSRRNGDEAGPLDEAWAARLAPAADVRAALALTLSDPSHVGIVYATDIINRADVRVLKVVPVDEAPAIRYGIARVRASAGGGSSAADTLYAFLRSREAVESYLRYGFSTPGPADATPAATRGTRDATHDAAR